MYAAGWSFYGEAGAEEFSTSHEAISWIVEMVEHLWDEDAHVDADERWLDVHTALHTATVPFEISTSDGCATFWAART